MNTKRLILYFALSAVALVLWTTWERDHHRASFLSAFMGGQPDSHLLSDPVTPGTDNPHNPAVAQVLKIDQVANKDSSKTSTSVPVSAKKTRIPADRLISVETDFLQVSIDKKGGNIVGVKFKRYPLSLKQKDKPFELLTDQPDELYVAESGMTGAQGPDTDAGPLLYQASQANYQIAAQDKPLTIELQATKKTKGTHVKVVKTFTFKPGRYTIGVKQRIENIGSTPWSGHFYTQIRHHKERQVSTSLMHLHTFTGAAFYDDGKYKKLSYKKMDKESLNKPIKGGWLAMQRQYFISSWVPSADQINHYYSRAGQDGVYTIGMVGSEITLKPKATHTSSASFYAGPEEADTLKLVAPGLDLTVDYGWLWLVSMAIFWLMKHIYLLVGNWGAAIILVTLSIKLIFFKLSESSYRSMARMKKLQPRIVALRERLGSDKQKLSQATMALYREEKVNPMGGCLPFLIQIPFFIALYYVLIESVELRQAPFIFWIQDLAAKDPYFVLPVLMGVSMFFQQKMTPSSPDPTQAKMMMALPVVFTFLFVNFPSGLVLYWLTNNCLSILQQWYITRRIEAKSS